MSREPKEPRRTKEQGMSDDLQKKLEFEQMRRKEAENHLRFTLYAAKHLYKPDQELPAGLNPMHYFTLTYKGDAELIEKTKAAEEHFIKWCAE